MLLENDNDVRVENPSAEQIQRAVDDLPNRDGSFIILGSGPMDYMQVAANGYAKFVVEYQEGDATRHFRTTEELDQTVVVELLLSYLQRDARWKTRVGWQKDVDPPKRFNLLTICLVLWMLGFVAMLPVLGVHAQWTGRLSALGIATMGLGFVANVASGIFYKRIQSRSSILTPGEMGEFAFKVVLLLNALIAGICAWASATFW